MLVGRSRECARIDELLAAATRGRSGALVVRGEPGVGKSALLRHAATRAPEFRVLTTTGGEPDADFAFSALHQILHPILDRLDEIPDVQARALEGALALAAAQGAGRMYVGAAALSLLSAVAEERPVLCLIDDAQWLDPASVDAFRFAARRLEAEGVVMLFAVTDGLRELDATGIDEVEIVGLDADAVGEMLRALAPSIADGVVARLAEATRGNALTLAEIPNLLTARQLEGLEPLPHPLPIGDRLVRTLVAKTESMSREGKTALLIAAASSTDSMRVISEPNDDLPRELEEAERFEILELSAGTIRFAHPSFRSAFYQAASPADRREAHRRLAELLVDEPRYRERRAWHLAAAATGPDDVIAAEIESIAADTERRRAHVNAAALFELAARLSVDDGVRARRLVEAAAAARLAGHADHASSLAGLALDAADDPSVRVGASIVQGLVALASGDMTRHDDHVAAAEAVTATDPGLASRLLAVTAEMRPAPDAMALALRAVALAPAGSAAEVYAAVAEARVLVRSGEQARAAVRTDDAASLLRSDPVLAEDPEILLAVVEGLADVRGDERILEELLQLASDSAREHTLVVLPKALLHRSYLEHARGAWRDAYVHAFEAARLFEETGQSRLAVPARAWLALIEAWFGHEEAATQLAERVRYSKGHEANILGLAADRIEGVLALTCGRSDRAKDPLHRWTEGSKAWPALLPTSSIDTMDAIEALVRSGDVEVARSLRSTDGESADDDLVPVCLAWADGVLEVSGEASSEAFGRALDAARALPVSRPFLEARISLAFGERLRREGERARAREQLRAARAGFHALETEPWTDRAGQELQATGERVQPKALTGIEDLTPQELQVARVIAGGATNKEAAARLFLAPKTIEFHLGKVYRKLGIRSRTELAAKYARDGEGL